MYSHVACDVMKERTLYLLKPSSLIWHLMPYLFLSSFAIILTGKRELVALLCLSSLCLVALPHGAVGWSAVCDCGIF